MFKCSDAWSTAKCKRSSDVLVELGGHWAGQGGHGSQDFMFRDSRLLLWSCSTLLCSTSTLLQLSDTKPSVHPTLPHPLHPHPYIHLYPHIHPNHHNVHLHTSISTIKRAKVMAFSRMNWISAIQEEEKVGGVLSNYHQDSDLKQIKWFTDQRSAPKLW